MPHALERKGYRVRLLDLDVLRQPVQLALGGRFLRRTRGQARQHRAHRGRIRRQTLSSVTGNVAVTTASQCEPRDGVGRWDLQLSEGEGKMPNPNCK